MDQRRGGRICRGEFHRSAAFRLYRDDPRLAYAESVFHFVKVTVDGDALTLEAIDADGRVFDQVTIRKVR